ncbi:MAG: PQQ-binding-like beta-propeller repeat protein [Proteobacteria bacterium]|nr:PQQ-binding-like beta-propeller repeat protein [Pseudomonadota bacterium]
MNHSQSIARFVAAGIFAALLLQAAPALAAPVAPNDPPDLGATPPDLSQSVDPNIFVTFDDSGSMVWTHMGDARPYDGSVANSTWDGPWRCANAINPDIGKASASYDIARKAMNGVYYNPNVVYVPPLYEDGTSFPNADATLKKVWQDGIAVNRPADGYPIAASTASKQYNNNPDGSSTSNSGSVTDLTGQYIVTHPSSTGGSCPGTADVGSCTLIINAGTNTTGCPTGAYGCGSTCIKYSGGKCVTTQFTWSDTYRWTTPSIADNRFMCGAGGTTGGSGDGRWTAARSTQNPFDGTVTDPLGGGTPNGGPVYWRFKASALNLLTLDSVTGKFTAAALTALYTPGNWESVSVPASQYQNYANWYAYYRYRNLMARSAMARVFGVIGGPSAANVRATWQNLGNNSNFNSPSQLPLTSIITNLDDNSTFAQNGGGSGTVGYRHAFFNWIFNVKASNGTPSRQALKRVGTFIQTNLPGSVTNKLSDPFWQPDASIPGGGQDLACRQNFHMLMTDGLYNGGTVSVSGPGSNSSSNANLPSGFLSGADPSTYTAAASNSNSPTTIFGHSAWTNDGDGSSTYSDMSFYYWVNNLRPDLLGSYPSDMVPAYFPDQSTGVTGAVATVDPADPGATPELFWNPANDPATWPHLVQFAVTLGAFGNLTYSDDMDCNKDTNGLGAGKNDLCFLRTGQTNSSGTTGWPRPNGAGNGGNGIAANIDDLWHAAVNSRGAFFVATDPSSLVQHLADIISSVLARAQSSTSTAVSNSIQSANVRGYTGGYDSGNWSGYLYKLQLDPVTAIALAAEWDAGCILTGGTFNPIAPTSQLPPRGECKVSSPPPPPPTRIIFTAKQSGSTLAGVPFQWASLGSTEQGYLNLDPTTTDVDTSTGQVITTASPTAPATNDGNGTDRVDYLRGKRDNETAPTSETLPRQFRIRKSLLGPIVNSQAMYEGGPSSGLQDIFPVGTPEQAAAAPCTAGLTAPGCYSYEKFVKDNISRRPMLYVGANDGMLHAFDANTGSEVWAYVPNMLYGNGQLDQQTNTASTLTSSVDDTPIINDVFLTTDSKWHTMLVGSMRLGARGIFALDITDQSNPASESAAAGKFMWEFTNANDPDLGYTYASTNIARLHNGKWVVLVTSGYFPQKLQVRSSTYGKDATPDTAPAASSGVTHMWVLDAATGAVIRKIDTPTGTISYGLSTPNVVDFGLDQIGDVSVAGDLAGNLWRFDLSDPNPLNWSVEVMFKSYSNTLACSAANPTGIGCEPITVQPEAFADSATGSVIYVFGSGQYLGPSDRNASSVLGTNHFFGVRDYGTGSSKYPLHESDLVSQTLTEDSSTHIRSLTANPVPTNQAGWMIPLDLSGISGERNVVKATPLFSAGIAILYSLIPGANNDPCTPGRIGAVMAVNAGTGGPLNPPSTPGGSSAVGARVQNPPATGGGATISPVGGGSVIIPGVGIVGGSGNNSFNINGGLPIWRRTSWHELLNNL